MIAAEEFTMDFGYTDCRPIQFFNSFIPFILVGQHRFTRQKVVETPTLVLLSCAGTEIPKAVLGFARVLMSKGVHETTAFQKASKRFPFLGCKSGLFCLFRVKNIDRVVSYIQITAQNDRFTDTDLQFILQKSLKVLVPLIDSVGEPFEIWDS